MGEMALMTKSGEQMKAAQPEAAGLLRPEPFSNQPCVSFFSNFYSAKATLEQGGSTLLVRGRRTCAPSVRLCVCAVLCLCVCAFVFVSVSVFAFVCVCLRAFVNVYVFVCLCVLC